MNRYGLMKTVALILALFLLTACGAGENNDGGDTDMNDNTNNGAVTQDGGESLPDGSPQFIMTAKISAIDAKITVEVIRAEYAFGTYLIILPDGTPMTDAAGNSITRADLSVGDTVEIVYNGQVMMSLPPQVVARRLRVID